MSKNFDSPIEISFCRSQPEPWLPTRDMKVGYLQALDDAEEQLKKYLGPLHAARVAVNELRKNAER